MASDDYQAAYDDLTDQLLADLSGVNTESSARRFASEGGRAVRRRSRQVPEFYNHEFINIFKDAVVARIESDMDALKQELSSLRSQADVATIELTTQMEAARAAGDQEAEHRLWREREQVQKEVDNKMQNVNNRLDATGPRIEALHRLASELKVNLG